MKNPIWTNQIFHILVVTSKKFKRIETDLNSQSKWISEQIIWNLGKTFPYTVFRPGNFKFVSIFGDHNEGFIGASSKTGCSNKEDYLNRLIVGLIQLKKYPNDVTNTNNVIPVDFVAKAIIGLSLETEVRSISSDFSPLV